MSYFPKTYACSKNKLKVEFDLSNHATKSDSKKATGVHTSNFAKKSDSAGLKSDIDQLEKVPTGLNSSKSKVDEIDVDKLKPVPNDQSKLSDVVKN